MCLVIRAQRYNKKIVLQILWRFFLGRKEFFFGGGEGMVLYSMMFLMT